MANMYYPLFGGSPVPLSTMTGSSKKEQKTLSPAPRPTASSARLFGVILELEAAVVWDFLSAADVRNLLEARAGLLSDEFIDATSLKALDTFCLENKTHLGRQCGCDWMRSLTFIPHSDDICTDNAPYAVEKTLPVLQVPGGARAMLSALVVTEKLLEASKQHGWPQDLWPGTLSTFIPVVCPLVTEEKLRLCPCTEKDAKRVMNKIGHNAGSRFFHEYKRHRGPAPADYLDHHWHKIDGNVCQYCKNHEGYCWDTIEKWRLIHENCRKVYRPLKAAMTEELQLVRFVPQPKGFRAVPSTLVPGRHYRPYEGLVAGITEDGILCGLYLVTGFRQHSPRLGEY